MKQMKFNSGKTILALLLGFSAVAFINACSKKDNNTTPPATQNAYVSVTNASPSSNVYAVYSDTMNIYSSGTLGYGTTTGISGGNPYETIVAGNHTIKLTSGGSTVLLDSNGTFTGNNYYSFIVYDTGENLKTLSLKDNLTAPSSGNAEVRFLNLSPNSTALNVWLINTDTTMKDSVQFSNVGYAGTGSVSADSLASFKTVTAGTYKVLVNSIANLNLFMMDSITLSSGKIYTLYSKGYVNGINNTDSLGVGVINNF
ncbi:MAG TPA: DUF4397 domain-containing protein [Puia sp.]|nr:DUF4397 domain-containing protein [Puia sp.]